MNYLELHKTNIESMVQGRYLNLEILEPILEKLNNVHVIGKSGLKKPIYEVNFGTGKTKVLLWSQMHGNESTTTKAILDFFNFLNSNSNLSNTFLSSFTFKFIPMLNPDGADLYTRENANKVDLNRDFLNLSQPESILLFDVFTNFKPDFCYNLHDQRTIFGAGDSGKPATVSFLAPSYNQDCDYNEVRLKAVNVIVAINKELQKHIKGQVGRFDDSFNRNCVGDTFQSLNVPTILFEAGHYPNDYQREETRKYIYIALVESFKFIYENDIVNNKLDEYLRIPQNHVCFNDFIYKNVKINLGGSKIITNFAAQYKEVLKNKEIVFEALITCVGNAENLNGHLEYDAKGLEFSQEEIYLPTINQIASFKLGNSIEFVNGLRKNQ